MEWMKQESSGGWQPYHIDPQFGGSFRVPGNHQGQTRYRYENGTWQPYRNETQTGGPYHIPDSSYGQAYYGSANRNRHATGLRGGFSLVLTIWVGLGMFSMIVCGLVKKAMYCINQLIVAPVVLMFMVIIIVAAIILIGLTACKSRNSHPKGR